MRLLGSVLLLVLTTIAVSAHTQTQLCWVVGRFDNTVYYAEAEGREDRSASFTELLDISGIDHSGVSCVQRPARDYINFKGRLLRDWENLELEVIDTTYMSDLDY